MKDEKKVKLRLGKRGSGKSYYVKHKDIPNRKRLFIYDTLGEYTKYGVAISSFREVCEFLNKKEKFKIVYQPIDPYKDFNDICELLWTLEDFTFIVEELDQFCSPYEIPPGLAHIIQRGRHKEIEFIGVSQRPYGMNRLISSQAKEIITFIQTEPRDIKYLSDYIGEELSNVVSNLKQYEFLRWKPEGFEIDKI